MHSVTSRFWRISPRTSTANAGRRFTYVPVIRRNAMMRAWAAQGLLSPTQMIGPDGLHMTDAGYDRLARAATAQLLANAGLPQDAGTQN